ncbi:hypothetical protein KIL84_009588 [Mauremys mutica]|uniref:Ig-like domain-containing protein n=1 Tax=Mauremys mutica TaxID=74926 RepID=A0A9D3XJQ4_9SAUR|nr:hypothetical protein KIL84_009588 [Mauremys mutica]
MGSRSRGGKRTKGASQAHRFCTAACNGATTALLFGSGTRLTVEPKNPEPSSPSVFVVKSANAKPSDGNKLTAACLVKDFFPKNIKVNMSQETDTVYKSKEGILSSNGKYSMIQVVKVEPNEDVGCYVTHEGINYNQTKPQSAPTTAPINNTQVCESSNSMVEEPNMEKVNMLSVTVLGLRVLLAKSIAFNMLMTLLAGAQTRPDAAVTAAQLVTPCKTSASRSSQKNIVTAAVFDGVFS